jgi:Ran GTPase-activating protein (RanGAP) involved in mRNA processing and transport
MIVCMKELIDKLKTNDIVSAKLLTCIEQHVLGWELGNALSQNTSLKKLHIHTDDERYYNGEVSCDRLLCSIGNALSRNVHLNTLTIRATKTFNHGRNIGVQSIANGLTANTSLQKLVFRSNSLSPFCGVYIGHALATNTSLTHLEFTFDIADATSYEFGLQDVGAKHICEHLETNTTLRTLIMNGNYISSAYEIFRALRCNTTLTELQLNDNQLVCAYSHYGFGEPHLESFLRHNTTLTSLSLNNNALEIDADVRLGDALACNTTLKSLDLGSNLIGDVGVMYMLSCRTIVNSTLTSLNLSENQLTRDGACAISYWLDRNSSLKHLRIDGQDIGNLYVQESITSLSTNYESSYCGIVAICESALIHPTLVSLDIGAVELADASAIYKLIAETCTLKNVNLSCNELVRENVVLRSLRLNTSITNLAYDEKRSSCEMEKELEINRFGSAAKRDRLRVWSSLKRLK